MIKVLELKCIIKQVAIIGYSYRSTLIAIQLEKFGFQVTIIDDKKLVTRYVLNFLNNC